MNRIPKTNLKCGHKLGTNIQRNKKGKIFAHSPNDNDNDGDNDDDNNDNDDDNDDESDDDNDGENYDNDDDNDGDVGDAVAVRKM